MSTDYHIHTPLCRHATGTPAEFAAAAKAAGLDEIGFADHNPMPTEFDAWRMLDSEFDQYLQFVNDVRSQGVEVRLGLECDYLPGNDGWISQLTTRAEWDYLIGSVHYISPDWAVDDPEHVSRISDEGVEQVWETYWTRLTEAVRSRLFDFIAHPDLPKKFGYRPQGDLTRFYEPVIAALAEVNGAFEINTAGLRKPVKELYPAAEFLQLARAAEIPLVINSDSHSPAEIGQGFAAAQAAARTAGYTQILRFRNRERFLVPL